MSYTNSEVILMTELKKIWEKFPEDMPIAERIERLVGPAVEFYLHIEDERKRVCVFEMVAMQLNEQDTDLFMAFTSELQALTNPGSVFQNLDSKESEAEVRRRTALIDKYGILLPRNWNKLWAMTAKDLKKHYAELDRIRAEKEEEKKEEVLPEIAEEELQSQYDPLTQGCPNCDETPFKVWAGVVLGPSGIRFVNDGGTHIQVHDNEGTYTGNLYKCMHCNFYMVL